MNASASSSGTFARSDFTYDHKHGRYTCAGAKELKKFRRNFTTPRSDVDQDGFIRYRASRHDCDGCSLKPRCCPGQPARKVPRSIREGARDMARDLALTDAHATSRRERKKIEMLFAHLKRILKLDRLRGPNGARDKFLLAATSQNLRKLAKLIPAPSQPAPGLHAPRRTPSAPPAGSPPRTTCRRRQSSSRAAAGQGAPRMRGCPAFLPPSPITAR